MTAAPRQTSPNAVADSLRGATVSVRQDLQVSRHVFRGEPAYVICDPVSFASHRITPAEYAALIQIEARETLGDAFEATSKQRVASDLDEDDFYGLVMYLHRAGMLRLPISDHKSLHQRYLAKRRARGLSVIMSPLFMRVPLWNPDAFLDRTIAIGRWLFTWPALALWTILILAAAAVAWVHRGDLAAPLVTSLELENLPLLWVILVGLKVFHEFGHAFACKRFGGRVPEMGAFFIVGTPAAYVDASAAWGFPSARERLIVTLAGMYIEIFIAAIALLVWTATSPGLINTAAYQTMLMASVVTVAMNLNPLAKFDGYYILTDLVGIPNLRSRAREMLVQAFDRVVLGLRPPVSQYGPFTRVMLTLYGVGSSLYRVVLVMGIAAVIASKAFVVGMAVAALYIGFTAYTSITGAVKHMFLTPARAEARTRAAIATAAGLLLAIVATALIPIRSAQTVHGVVTAEDERTIFAPSSGFIIDSPPQPGARPTGPAVRLQHPDVAIEQAAAEADYRLALAEFRTTSQDPTNGAAAATARARLSHAQSTLEFANSRAAEQLVTLAPGEQVIAHERELLEGTFVQRGEPLFRAGGDATRLRAVARTELITRSSIGPGSAVRIRTALEPGTIYEGVIESIAPAASRDVPSLAITSLAGGDIAVDAQTEQASESLVLITVRLPDEAQQLPLGLTARLHIPTKPEAVAWPLIRRVRRVIADLSVH